jgi:hypothetical protein
LKGGNSRWQRKERKQRRKNQRRKRGIKARRLITIPNAFGITIPNFNPGGEFNFPPGFFARNGGCSALALVAAQLCEAPALSAEQ